MIIRQLRCSQGNVSYFYHFIFGNYKNLFTFGESNNKTMAASDKSKKGKRVDYARHLLSSDYITPICGNKRFGYATIDINDVDCIKCLKKINKNKIS